jgi:hypothetical protein
VTHQALYADRPDRQARDRHRGAGLHIPATAGFGVTYTGLHATDERFRTDTVPTIQANYHTALLTLLR